MGGGLKFYKPICTNGEEENDTCKKVGHHNPSKPLHDL
jgi:hypothetical protein